MDRRELVKAMASGMLATGLPQSPRVTPEATGVPSIGSWTPVAPGIWKATLGTPEFATPVRSRSIPMALDRLKTLPEVKLSPLPAPSFQTTARGVELDLPLAAGELMYGFGLQLMSFQQRSKKRTIRVNADPRGDSGDSHAPVPFYVTTHGYGVLVDTFRQAAFYCGQARPKPQTPVQSRSLEVNTPQWMRARDRQLTSKVLVEVPRCAGVDVYLFGGPSLREAVQRYNLFSGGGVLPPEWGLGFWYRPEMHLSGEEVLALAKEFRANHIPCDVLGLEPGWQTHAYSCTFAWDKTRFPSPHAFIQEAQRIGFKINLWEHAFTHPAAPFFSDLVPHSGNIAVWDGLVPDFAGDPARRIFGDYHGRELIDRGVSGFKLDECDSSDFTEGWSFPDQSHFPSGVDGEQMHAQFGLRYQDTILDQFRKRGKQTYSLVRSSGSLAAPYPFVLYSDLYDHRQFIRALVNASFSGLLWCPEVRDAVSEEDLIRRLQSAVFSPLAMVNAWYIRNPPWKQIDREKNNRNEFSDGWAALQARCREIISLRMRFLPYLRAAFAVYERDGLPPFRALAMDYPDDPLIASIDDEYMMGDRLLVAPMFAGEPTREIVFPKGQWQDFWTGATVEGRKITLPDSTSNMPAYIRQGSLMPWAEIGHHSESPESRRLSVRVYGEGNLGWTAGSSVGGLNLAWDPTAKKLIRRQTDSDRPFEITGWTMIG